MRRLLLEAAAIVGDPFEPELAYEVAELDPAAGVDALDELLDAKLLHPTAVPRRFAFRHPLVRRAVYESAKGGWRLSRTRRAAAAMQARGASSLERAHHVEYSAVHGDSRAIATLRRGRRGIRITLSAGRGALVRGGSEARSGGGRRSPGFDLVHQARGRSAFHR